MILNSYLNNYMRSGVQWVTFSNWRPGKKNFACDTFYIQWNILTRTLENRNTCIIRALDNGPKVSLCT